MWGITNQTPFAAERSAVRDRTGQEIWLVVVRGTFAILPDGSTEIAPKQEPVCLAPVYFGDPSLSSLRYDSDMILTKPATDVLLHGHAYAPGGRPAKEVQVTMIVGTIKKTLRVVGDRVRKTGVILGSKFTDPEPFEKMPLIYERAFGGQSGEPPEREPRNPVGRGFLAKKGDPAKTLVPNIEYPGDATRPAGFGPIAPVWLPRRTWAGTYNAAWEKERKPLVPTDFDDRYFQSAPEDQIARSYLGGDEKVELVNLTPTGLLTFRLPQVTLGFSTRLGRRREHHRANLHTVILEPDLMRVQMVWHSALPCHYTLYELLGTTVFVKPRLNRDPEVPSAAAVSSSRRVP